MKRTIIPARSAITIELSKGQRCRVINTEGGQVVDTWAFNPYDFNECLSMEHSRSAIYRLLFRPGDVLVSNKFQPMLTLTDDTSPGFHDTLHAACSTGSNRFYGSDQIFPNCQDNLQKQLGLRGQTINTIPCPWNLFEHALIGDRTELKDEISAAAPEDYVELEARMDLVMIFSACPSLVGKISGTSARGAAIGFL
jgi:uncharacterized protein